MAETFKYYNKATKQTETRPLEPSLWDTLKERVVDTSEIDKQRAAAKAMNAGPIYKTVRKPTK